MPWIMNPKCFSKRVTVVHDLESVDFGVLLSLLDPLLPSQIPVKFAWKWKNSVFGMSVSPSTWSRHSNHPSAPSCWLDAYFQCGLNRYDDVGHPLATKNPGAHNHSYQILFLKAAGAATVANDFLENDTINIADCES